MLVWLLLPLAGAEAQDQRGPRLALVVGNSNYAAVAPLRNAVGDAQAVADTLTSLGFEVTLLQDGNLKDMNEAIADMARRANQGAEATLFYYSGHGFQLRGANYIVPVDAVLDNRDAIGERTLRLDDIIMRLSSETRQTLILLDACRDNPLPASVRDKDAANGLADVATGVNTYIAFATKPGGVSTDGTGNGGPFAKALVSNMSVPEISINEMMRNVRAAVYEETGGVQMPWASDSLLADFSFNRGVVTEGIQFKKGRVADIGTGIVLGPMPTKKPPLKPVVVEPQPEPEPAPVVGTGVEIPSGPEVLPGLEKPAVGASPPQVAMVDPSQVLPPLEAPVIGGTEIELGEDPATVVEVPPTEPDPEEVLKVAMAVQKELKRIGCYTGGIDGDFGSGSQRALKRYFDSKKIPAAGSEPSQQIHALLTAEEGIVCEPEKQVVVQTTPKKASGGQATTTKTSDPPAVTTTKKPLTLGGGSGVFR